MLFTQGLYLVLGQQFCLILCNKSNWNSGSTATSSNTINQNFNDTFNSTSIWNGTSWSISGGDYFSAIIDETFNTNSNGNFKTCNCTINETKDLIVSHGGSITIENNIINKGNITVNSGGSIVQVSASGVNTGTNYTVERQTTIQSSFNVFTYWSTPITSATFAAVSPTTHEYFSFNNATQQWILGTATTPMIPGIGYALEGPDTGTYPGRQKATFSGAPFNNGNITNILSFSDDGNADNDWNLVGNPYPSAIDADIFLRHNSKNIGGTIYFWTHNTAAQRNVKNTEDDYAMYNATGGTAAVTGGTIPNGNIASSQGFFVQALNSVTVSNFFNNKMRLDANNTIFFKTDKKSEKDRLWLNLENNSSFSQILIGFLKDGKDSLDNKYDGLRILSKTSLNFYSILKEKKLGIQGKSSLKNNQVIPLGFTSNKKGVLTISLFKIEGKLLNAEIYIEDLLLNKKHNLKSSDYDFNVNKTGEINKRFNLVINYNNKESDLNELNDTQNETKIVITSSDNFISINSNIGIKKIDIYNILGKKLVLKTNFKNNKISKSLFNQNDILVFRITLKSGKKLVKKFLVK